MELEEQKEEMKAADEGDLLKTAKVLMDIKDMLEHKLQVLMEEMVFLLDQVEILVQEVVVLEDTMEEVLEHNLVMIFHQLEEVVVVQI